MLLPRKVNEARHQVMRDLLILGVYRVEPCVGYDEDPEGTWREPSWMVHGMDRDEAIAFGRVFRQNSVLVCNKARPEIVVTDPTCDEVGRDVRRQLARPGLRPDARRTLCARRVAELSGSELQQCPGVQPAPPQV